ncbi:MAG: hypothetical protein ABR591_09290 [Candidatus Velthaea sp.]
MTRSIAAALALSLASAAAAAAQPQPVPHRPPHLSARSTTPLAHGHEGGRARHRPRRRRGGDYQPYVVIPPAYVESVLDGPPSPTQQPRAKPSPASSVDVFSTIKN